MLVVLWDSTSVFLVSCTATDQRPSLGARISTKYMMEWTVATIITDHCDQEQLWPYCNVLIHHARLVWNVYSSICSVENEECTDRKCIPSSTLCNVDSSWLKITWQEIHNYLMSSNASLSYWSFAAQLT